MLLLLKLFVGIPALNPQVGWTTLHLKSTASLHKLFDGIPAKSPSRVNSAPSQAHGITPRSQQLLSSGNHPTRCLMQASKPSQEPDETMVLSVPLLWLARGKLEILLILLNTDELAREQEAAAGGLGLRREFHVSS